MTGIPNSGKSEFIDALMCNLAEMHGWSFALCSMEKKVSRALISAPPLVQVWAFWAKNHMCKSKNVLLTGGALALTLVCPESNVASVLLFGHQLCQRLHCCNQA